MKSSIKKLSALIAGILSLLLIASCDNSGASVNLNDTITVPYATNTFGQFKEPTLEKKMLYHGAQGDPKMKEIVDGAQKDYIEETLRGEKLGEDSVEQ